MKITSIIVDDEQSSRLVLSHLLEKFCPEIDIVGEAANIEQAYHCIVERKPDLVFLDIHMPTGNGFELLKKFEKIPFDVIFVTSHDQFVINAIRFSALDYLLKPVEVSDLQMAVKRVVSKFSEKLTSAPNLVNLLYNLDEEEKKIALHDQRKVRFVNVSDIMYFEGDINYTIVVSRTGGKFTVAKTLKAFEELLADIPFFIRVNKSYLVNANAISDYTSKEPCIISLQNGKEIEISRRRKQEILSYLKRR